MKHLTYLELVCDWKECFGKTPSEEIQNVLLKMAGITPEQLDRLINLQQCAK
ncbi:hypothetical protein [Massiliimalia timonensis]|uniref:hypothetical protein n=1 Tax=Massiliimalia timonensis TaxID=1987501 RepID=UPI00189FE984|nr:hypothetical protein [Massiliimalia timonensis]